jgi:hypothetical protein
VTKIFGTLAKFMPWFLIGLYLYSNPLNPNLLNLMLNGAIIDRFYVPSWLITGTNKQEQRDYDVFPDLDMPYEDIIKAPMEIVMCLFSSLALGMILQYAGGYQAKDSDLSVKKVATKDAFLPNGALGYNIEPVSKILNIYMLLSAALSQVCLQLYIKKTGFQHVILSQVFQSGTDEIDPFSDPPMEFD